MASLCLYFKVHQPYRLRNFASVDMDAAHCYNDAVADEESINMAADQCYLPANRIMQQLIAANNGKFRVSYSISGTVIELLQQYRPDVIRSFRQLVDTGCVEILAETYYHSLSSLHSKKEFQRQVHFHSRLVKQTLGVTPSVFRNTELIHNESLVKYIAGIGLKGILCEGVERILQGRCPNHLYTSQGIDGLPLLLRNARLSDDIAFRFNDSNWSEHPLTAPKFADWLHSHPTNTEVINLFMDYETFGLHKKEDSGIFDFLQALPAAVLTQDTISFATPSEALTLYTPKDSYIAEQTISWEDRAEASCVWAENMMQHNTLKKTYSLEKMVMNSGHPQTIVKWGQLQSADHFYYMAEEQDKPNPHKYRNPFSSPHEAFQNYLNILADFEITLIREGLDDAKKYSSLRTVAMNFF